MSSRGPARAWFLGLAAVAILLLPGCGARGPRSSRGGYRADLSTVSVSPPSVMVVNTLPRTLFVVVSPGRVEDAFDVENTRHSVHGFHSFIGRALERAMSPYFRHVRVVDSVPGDVEEPHYVADVRVDVVEARNLVVGDFTYAALRMQWAFAIRPSEANEYVFTFAGDGVSERSYARLEMGFQQMLVSAIGNMMTAWTEGGVFERLVPRASEPSPPARGRQQ